MNSKLNGYFKWVAFFVTIGLGGIGGFYHLKGTVRVAESNIEALEEKVDGHYQTILRELDTIKSMLR